jgi:amino acid transporter
MTRAGITGLPHFVNACVLLSAFSSGSSLMYSASRMIYGMALRGYAPRILARTTKRGLPIVALTLVNCFMPLAYMSLGKGAATVFNWFSNLTALSGYVVWGMIGVTYLRFKAGVEAQGIDRKQFQ